MVNCPGSGYRTTLHHANEDRHTSRCPRCRKHVESRPVTSNLWQIDAHEWPVTRDSVHPDAEHVYPGFQVYPDEWGGWAVYDDSWGTTVHCRSRDDALKRACEDREFYRRNFGFNDHRLRGTYQSSVGE